RHSVTSSCVRLQIAAGLASIGRHDSALIPFHFYPSPPGSFRETLRPSLRQGSPVRIVKKEAHFHFSATFRAPCPIWLHRLPPQRFFSLGSSTDSLRRPAGGRRNPSRQIHASSTACCPVRA